MTSAAAAPRRRDVALAFGAVLRAVRHERGVSQDALAQRCEFDRTYTSLLERGLRQPSLFMLLRLAIALKIAPERLVTETVAQIVRISYQPLKAGDDHDG